MWNVSVQPLFLILYIMKYVDSIIICRILIGRVLALVLDILLLYDAVIVGKYKELDLTITRVGVIFCDP